MAQERGSVRNGIGTYKLKDGSVRYRTLYRARGKLHSRGGFKTKGAAQAFLNTARVSVDTGTHVASSNGKVLFSDWADGWSASVVDVRASTRTRDQIYLRSYIMPTFGPMQLRQIDYETITEWAAMLAKKGGRNGGPLAPATVQKAYQVLSKIMATAVSAGKIARTPCQDIKLPSAGHQEARFLSPDELLELEAAIEQAEVDRYGKHSGAVTLGLVVPFLADTGLRIGEAAALRWRDVDLNTGTVTVRETFVELEGAATFNAPKTAAGRRVVPTLTEEVGERLAERRSVLEHGPDDFVWQGPRGGVLRPNAFRGRFWKPAIALAGLADPQPTPHALRHTAVAHWIAAGVEPLKVSRWAGHRSIATVYNVYGHLLKNDADGTRSALSALRAAAKASQGTE